MVNSVGKFLHSSSIGVAIFFSLIFSYFCFLVAALRPCMPPTRSFIPCARSMLPCSRSMLTQRCRVQSDLAGGYFQCHSGMRELREI